MRILKSSALRLARFFGTDAQSWMSMQTHYDLEIMKDKISEKLEKDVHPHDAAA